MSNNNSKTAFAFAAGLATGAMISIFFVSDSRFENRQKVNNGCKKFVAEIKVRFNKKIPKLLDMEENIEEAVKEVFAEDTDEYI